jgi:hypothetical protein
MDCDAASYTSCLAGTVGVHFMLSLLAKMESH